jgi:hypothetical protein
MVFPSSALPCRAQLCRSSMSSEPCAQSERLQPHSKIIVIRFTHPKSVQPLPKSPGASGVVGAVSVFGAGLLADFDEVPWPTILNMPVPQVGHLPLIALRPFFSTDSMAPAMSVFALHFTQ